ncbi:hypothetical protein JZ751_002644 [Albula glossodonta]|uniref:Prospero domain-containing protein n=1 Tax=Albula glossodonta TaxID=121402 RepID=A0A8T2NIQ1_9TELE|nr:hypothetical protein JZ751_002644 [Albula glossodonta]
MFEPFEAGKFNRCITSQLIKWFSNFREFYYIQMEKFARQAINDGATGTEELSVSRDSELYRALNMHYNKANDFELTSRQTTLSDFVHRWHGKKTQGEERRGGRGGLGGRGVRRSWDGLSHNEWSVGTATPSCDPSSHGAQNAIV